MNKPKMFLVLWSWRWRNHDNVRYEISHLKNHKIKVTIFEFIDYLYPHFVPAYKNIKPLKQVIKIKGLEDLKDRLKKLEKKYDLIILNTIDSLNTRGLLINYFLNRQQKNIVIELRSSQIPVFNYNFLHLINFQKFKKFLISPLTAYYYLKGYFFSWLRKRFKLFPNYLLRAGYKHYPDYMEKYGVKIRDINSLDYSNYLTYKLNRNNKKKYILFIDSPAPKFKGDGLLYKSGYPFTSEKWYPSLNNFFTKIEKKFKLKVLIAPHPKVKYKDRPKYLGYRKVTKRKIYDLIDNSKFIITRLSTAISLAIVCKKPILFIYSDQLDRHKSYMNELNLFLDETGSESFNIDDKFENFKVKNLMKINMRKYKNYKKNYITALNKKKSNNQLINNIFKENF